MWCARWAQAPAAQARFVRPHGVNRRHGRNMAIRAAIPASVATVVTLVTLMVAARSTSAQCVSFESEPPDFLRSEHETRLLATVLEGRPRDLRTGLPDRLATHAGPRGQLVTVQEADGPGARLLATDSVAVIMRWRGTDDACRPIPARDSLPLGSQHLFTAVLRPESLWVGSRPSFDVYDGLFGDYSASDTARGSPPLGEYRQFLDILPSRADWASDCRPGVRRVERWLEAHPRASRGYPFRALQARLRPACEGSIGAHVFGLERWRPAQSIPYALRRVLREQRCRDDPDVFAGAQDAVDGHFVASDAPQWVFICPGTRSWRLLVVVLEPRARIIELARVAGQDWDWIAGSAPAEYFDWTSSPDFGSGRWHVARPKRGVVLLKFISGDQEQTLAFFQTPGGWVHVGVRCCYWPE